MAAGLVLIAILSGCAPAPTDLQAEQAAIREFVRASLAMPGFSGTLLTLHGKSAQSPAAGAGTG